MNTALLENNLQARSAAEIDGQYSLARILGIWASVALPMGLIRWAVVPILIPRVDINPGFLYLILITLGLAWQGVIAYIILRQEVKPFTWEGLKERLWLYTPTNPRTGVCSRWLYLWTIPLFVIGEVGYASLEPLKELWIITFPFLAPPAYAELQNLAGPAVGQWWLLGVLAVLIVFNYLLGEIDLPGNLVAENERRFREWDFIANNILFMTYHLHKIEVWPKILIINWIWPWAAKRFKSSWVAVIIHGFDAVVLLVIFPMAIMGMLK